MDFSPAILSLARAVAYKYNSLTERYLQEAGASVLSTYALHRYTLIPAIIWAIIFVRPSDIAAILQTPHQLLYFGIIFVIWNIQQYAHSFRVNSTSTVSALSNLYNVLTLPLLLIAGTFFNHDAPNGYSIAAIVVLVVAMLVKPAHHILNNRARYSRPVPVLIGFICLEALVDVVLIALCRQLLKEIPPHVFIGVFDILVLISCALCVAFLAKRQPMDVKAMVKKHPLRSISLPIIFFAGSVVEFYAQAALPIYIMISIGAITFVMDIFSDVYRKRIQINFQTISFVSLVFVGICLAVYAIQL